MVGGSLLALAAEQMLGHLCADVSVRLARATLHTEHESQEQHEKPDRKIFPFNLSFFYQEGHAQ